MEFPAWAVVAAGSTTPGACAQLSVAGFLLITAAVTWAFGSAFPKSGSKSRKGSTEAGGQDEPDMERVGAAEYRFIMYRMPVEIFLK